MSPLDSSSQDDCLAILKQMQASLQSMKSDFQRLSASVESIEGRVNVLSSVKQMDDAAKTRHLPDKAHSSSPLIAVATEREGLPFAESLSRPSSSGSGQGEAYGRRGSPLGHSPGTLSSKIILTTYPSQSGIDPMPMAWGDKNPARRGPVVVSRAKSTVRRRNAIGAHGGSYSIYYALAVASKNLNLEHKPDFTNTEPAVNIGPFPQWSDAKKIVSMDPLGHLAPWLFADTIRDEHLDIRPTIAITKAHMKLPELEQRVRLGRLVPDGKICLNETGELAVTKFAVEPVWYLPGVAERFGIVSKAHPLSRAAQSHILGRFNGSSDEGSLRRSLFESTGGSYPELITRGDIKLFLPPIGGLTVYCFGDVSKMSDPNVRLALRVHDECNGSDVFGSDICTCRPYLIFGVEEAVKEAQQGGSGVVIYFRKEGRALGEVTKYLVYNARKRGTDRASEYFQRTENIAGVKDMRFQALMPDVLHWLGITKIDRMLSMSNMKHDAIVDQGIPIHERVPIPDDLIPEDSRVEIDAKIHAGYFTTGKIMTDEELAAVQGRAWDDVDH